MRPNGEAIQESRKAQQLSLREVSKRANVHYTHLWRAEKGLSDMSEDKLQRLAGALGEPIEKITHDDTPQEKQ